MRIIGTGQFSGQRMTRGQLRAQARDDFIMIEFIESCELDAGCRHPGGLLAEFGGLNVPPQRTQGDEVRRLSDMLQPGSETLRLFDADGRQLIVNGGTETGLTVSNEQQSSHV